MVLYYYLYFKLYKLALLFGARDSEFSAVTSISLLVSLNLLVVAELIKINTLITKYYATLFVIVLIILNSILFLVGNRYEKIKQRFELERRLQRIAGNVVVVVYVLLSLTLPLFLC